MPSPVRFAKVRKQLEAAGYKLVRISSSHHIFECPGQPLVSIPVHNNQVKPFYARQVEKIVASSREESRQTEASGEQAPKRHGRGKGKNR